MNTTRIITYIEGIFPVSLASLLSIYAILGILQDLNQDNIFLMKIGQTHVISVAMFVLFILYFLGFKHDNRLAFYVPIQTYAIHEIWFFTIGYDFKFVSFERFAIGLISLTSIILACFFISTLKDTYKLDWLIVIWNIIGLTFIIWLIAGFSSSVAISSTYTNTEYFNDVRTNMLEVFSWVFPLSLLLVLSKFFSDLKLEPSG